MKQLRSFNYKHFYVFLTVSALLLTIESRAQLHGQAKIDSLVQQLSKADDDTNKVKMLQEISFDYYGIDPDKGIDYGHRGLALAEKLEWKKGIANMANVIGINYSFGKSDDVRGLDYFLKALKVAEEISDNKRIAGCLNNIASIYDSKKDYEKALEYYLKALVINKKMGNQNWEAINLSNIGVLYANLNRHKEALDYKSRALKLNTELGDSMEAARNLTQLSKEYWVLADYEKIMECIDRACAIYKSNGQTEGIASVMGDYGNTYQNLITDTHSTARNFLQKHLSGNKPKALFLSKQYLDSAIALNGGLGLIEQLSQDYKGLSITQQLIGDYEGALKSHQLYFDYYDSLFNIEKDKKLTELGMNYEFEKKEATTKAEQEKKDIREKTIRNSIAGVLAGSLIFLVVVYRQRNKISKARRRSDELLLNILPSEVAEELKEKGSADAKQFDEVTVMFTDFKNFTAMSEKLNAQQLVNEINYCYSAFDNIISKYGIEKIKTIGDSYMCAGGLPVTNKTNAEDTVRAALEISEFMKAERQKREAEGKTFFEIRIGVHTGPVVAGIVGIKKFAYDIWGDTVNIASRMESSGEAGKVNISGSTYELVKDKFNCTHRGKIQAKNKGEIDMYFVENKM